MGDACTAELEKSAECDPACEHFFRGLQDWLQEYLGMEMPQQPGVLRYMNACCILEAQLQDLGAKEKYKSLLVQACESLCVQLGLPTNDFSTRVPVDCDEAVALLLPLNCIAYDTNAAVKGPSDFPSVMLCLKNFFLGEGNQTDKYPLEATFQLEGGGDQGSLIEDFTVGMGQGASVCAACHLAMLYMYEKQLLQTIVRDEGGAHKDLARKCVACLRLRAVAKSYDSTESLVYESLRSKRHAALRVGPTPLQIAFALDRVLPEERRLNPKKTTDDLVLGILRRFTKRERVNRAKYSNPEIKAVRFLVSMMEHSPKTVAFIQSVWAKTPMHQSSIALDTLACTFLDAASEVAVRRDTNPTWYGILTWTVEKVHEFVVSCGYTYDYNVRSARAVKKKPKIDTAGYQYRVKEYVLQWRFACLNISGLPTMLANLAPSRLEDVQQMCKNSDLLKDAKNHLQVLDPGFEYEHIRYMRRATCKRDVACPVDGVSELGTERKVSEMQAKLATFDVLLQRQRSKFIIDRSRLQQWETTGQSEAKRCLFEQKQAYDSVIDGVLDRGFSASACTDFEVGANHLARALAAYAQPDGVDAVLTIHIIDMAKYLQRHSKFREELAAGVAAKIREHPQKTCTIILEPSTTQDGDTMEPSSRRHLTLKAWEEVKNSFNEEAHDLQIRTCIAMFNVKTQYSDGRKLTLEAIMCVSRQGSAFEASKLWKNQGVPILIPYFPRRDMKDWSKVISAADQSGIGIYEKASYNTGVDLTIAWIDAALHGVQGSRRERPQKAFVCEWSLWDDCVAEACLEMNCVQKARSRRFPAIGWAGIVRDNPQRSRAVVANVVSSLRSSIKERVHTRRFIVDGFQQKDASAQERQSEKPAIKDNEYELTYPTSSGALLIRDEVLHEMEAALNRANCEDLKSKFKEIVARHNAVANPSGNAWIQVSPDKRSQGKRAFEFQLKPSERVEPINIPKPEGAYQDISAFTAGVVEHMRVRSGNASLEYLFAPEGDVWYTHCLEDTILERTPLATLKGKFKHGNAATAAITGGGTEFVEFAITHDEQVFLFRCDRKELEPVFGPISLRLYLEFLASHGIVGVDVHMHKCTAKENEDAYDVEPLEPVAVTLEPAAVRDNMILSSANISGYVGADCIAKSEYVEFVFPLEFIVKKNQLRPAFPVVMPKVPIAMKANEFVNLV